MASCSIRCSARSIGSLVAGAFLGVNDRAVSAVVFGAERFPGCGKLLLFDNPAATLGFFAGGGGGGSDVFPAPLFPFNASLCASKRAV